MDADFGNDLCLGVWKKRQNCYDVEHYDLVFKKRGDEEHGLLFQPDECTWKDTLVCPDVINQAIQSYDDDVRRMLEIAEHTKREMIRQGFADESEDEEYEDVEEVAPPTAISLPPAKTPRKVRQKAVRSSTRKTVADEDVPSSSVSRSPRQSVSVGINALFNYGSKAVSKTATVSKTSTKKLKKVQPSRTKKHKQATAAKKVAPQPENDVGDKVEVESTSDVAKLVDYHEKVISISTPAVVVAPQSSKPTGTRKTTAARRILVEEHEEDESDTPFSDENMETEDCGNDDQADSKEELLRNEMKRTVCMVDLSKDNLLLEGARNHEQPSTSREDYEDVNTVNEVNEKDSSEEDDDDEVDPSESRRSSRRSGRRLSGYAYSKKMTRERARSYRKSTVAKAMSQIPEDEEEVVETREVSETEVEEPGCSSATAPSQDFWGISEPKYPKLRKVQRENDVLETVTASSQTRDGQRKKPKRKPPVAGGTRKFNQKKSSTKSSFGSSTERFMTPTKQRTGLVPSTPSSSKKRGCMTPVSSKKHRGTVSYLNRSTGASRLRRAGDKTSATPVKTPVKYNPQAATVVKSFIHRNTPEKSLTKEAQLEAKRKLLEQKEREERERKLLIEEEKRMQIAETKRKREERARKANENRELNDLRRAEELKLKNEREQEKKARIEAKRKEDEEKKKLLEAKMTDKADKKRKHDNEKIDVKRQKMEEDAANEKQLEKAKKREEERLRKIQLKKEKAEKIRKEKELRAIARSKAKEEAEEKRRAEELRRKEEEEEREMELRREELRKKRDEDARKKRQEELQKKRAEELQKKREEELRKKREEELKKQREEEYKRNRDEEIRKRREDERKRLEEERKQLEREKERQRQEEECGDYNESMYVLDETGSDLDESIPPVVEFKTPTAVRKPDPVSTPLLDETYDVSEQDTSSVTQYNMTPAGPDKLRLASTKEDYNIHDLDSGDSTDEEDAPRKKVPSWASGFEFKKSMRHQCVTNPTSITARFPDARIRSKDVDLNKVFRKNRPRYNKRTSSACWSPKGPGHVSFHIPSDD